MNGRRDDARWLIAGMCACLASVDMAVAQIDGPPDWAMVRRESWDPLVDGELPLTVFATGRAGNLVWKVAEEAPTWWTRPVPKADRFSFAISSTGFTDTKAMDHAGNDIKRRVRDLLYEHLSPSLGAKETLPVLEALLKETVLVDAEVGPLPRGRDASEYEHGFVASLCWRVPIRAVVQQFDPAVQGRIEWILLRPVVRWVSMDAEPEWLVRVPTREGYLRRTTMFESTSAKNARLGVVSVARDRMHAHLLMHLQPVVGRVLAAQAADAGVARMAPMRRAFCGEFRRRRPKGQWLSRAWYLHEVPLAPVLSVLPAKLRGRASAALRKAK